MTRLTDTFVGTVTPPAKDRKYYRDDDQPGFGLVVFSSGTKRWIYEAEVFGKLVRRVLGDHTMYTAKQARMIAREVSGELRQGIDRFAISKRKVEEDKAVAIAELKKSQTPTIETVVEEYLRKSDLKPETHRFYTNLLLRELSPYATKKLQFITNDDIEKIYTEISELRSPIRATKAINFISTLCTFKRWETPIPKGFKKASPKARKARLEPTDGVKVWDALQEILSHVSGAYLATMLLTGCRTAELNRLTVGEVDLVAGYFTMADTKNGSSHRVYLSEAAIGVMHQFIEGREADELVFEGADDGRYARNRVEGLPKWSNHDLRKAFAITAMETNVQYPVIKAALNHTTGDVTLSHYAQATPSQLRTCWNKVSDFYTGKNNE